jgi:Arc/MetJ family transcription regulator
MEVHAMRTTLDLDENLVKELMAVTKAKTKTAAIHLAIREFIRRRRLEGLKALSGKIRLDLDWRELEEVERKDQERQQRQWRDRR